eukprot:CCRYP_003422-RA/>CCRYP_003422-RA protein AED:0.27 eAED:0.27 QI:40/1/1/1/0/0/2/0/95
MVDTESWGLVIKSPLCADGVRATPFLCPRGGLCVEITKLLGVAVGGIDEDDLKDSFLVDRKELRAVEGTPAGASPPTRYPTPSTRAACPLQSPPA